MIDRRTQRVWGYLLIGVFGALGFEFLPLMVFGRVHAPVPPFRIVATSLAIAASIAWLLIFATLSFRWLDEFAKEGSKFAWYWGATLGLAASAPLYVFVMLGGLHWIWPASPLGKELGRAFMMGYALGRSGRGLRRRITLVAEIQAMSRAKVAWS